MALLWAHSNFVYFCQMAQPTLIFSLANDWIWNTDLYGWKWPFYQLCHNHCTLAYLVANMVLAFLYLLTFHLQTVPSKRFNITFDFDLTFTNEMMLWRNSDVEARSSVGRIIHIWRALSFWSYFVSSNRRTSFLNARGGLKTLDSKTLTSELPRVRSQG